MKNAAIFSGQGSQFVGMAENVIDNAKIFEKASEIAGINILNLCNNTDIETLSKTDNSQIAIFTKSMASFYDLEEKIDAVAGFSLGEITAITAAGILSLEDGVKTVLKRGELMLEASKNNSGEMHAVLGLDDDLVVDICKNISEKNTGFVTPVNFNCPGQIVIAGESESCEKAIKSFNENGAKMVVKLPVSGAFHTKQMENAALEFKNFISSLKINSAKLPIYTNVSGDKLENFDLATHLYNHMISPVLFSKMIINMRKNEYTNFIELGAGKTLSGFIKRIK